MAFRLWHIGLASLALIAAFACGDSTSGSQSEEPLDSGVLADDAGTSENEEDASVEGEDASAEKEDASVVEEESDEVFCARFHAQCGSLTANDATGARRTVENCGDCDAPEVCDAETNSCVCQSRTCEDEGVTCGEMDDGCGQTIRCGDACEVSSVRVRLLAGNLTSRVNGGARQSYNGGHGIRIFKALKPDIAFVQEFNFGDNSPEDMNTMVNQAFGQQFHYVFQPRDTSVHIPNAVVSRYPILAWGVLDDPTMTDRDHVWARIDIPGDRDLWAVSVHIPTNGTYRQASIEQLIKDLHALSIPERDFLAIGGDFNTTSRQSDQALKLFKTDGALVVLDTDKDCPIDQAGDDDTNVTRTKDYDAIYTNQALKDLRVQVLISGAEGLSERGLVFDSRVFSPLSAVSPVEKCDSGSTEDGTCPDNEMQHMAVVKDFLIPQ